MSAINKLISRTAAGDDDNTDHIGTETPGSGVATPQPDLQDKRLPGIMSYFGQVRPDSTSHGQSTVPSPPCETSLLSEQLAQHQKSVLPSSQSQHHEAGQAAKAETQTLPDLKHLVISHARPSAELSIPQISSGHLVSCLTPPASHPPSSQCSDDARTLEHADPRCEVQEATSATRTKAARCPDSSSSDSTRSMPSEVPSHHVKDPEAGSQGMDLSGSMAPPSEKPSFSTNGTAQNPGKWYTLDGLKELTRGVMFKSGQSTPTRALSTAQPSQSEGRQSSGRNSHDDGTASGTQTPRGGPSGAQAPASKGKLTIKVSEARGLRKCRDPYVVVVFQRSELISGGPRPGENEEPINAATSGMGGIPIQRQGSDSGRTPMAIPMRSRQSSNTSISDYNTFRNRPRRQSFTNPTWDAEAVL